MDGTPGEDLIPCKDIVDILELIMTSKSIEDLRRKTIEYVMSNHTILINFFRRFFSHSTRNAHDAEHAKTTASMVKTVSPSKDANQNQKVSKNNDVEVAADVKSESSNGNQTLVKPGKSQDTTEAISTKCQVPKKRRKSKYDYIQGDLSHISREPKSRKYRDNSGHGKKTKKKTTHDQSEAEGQEVKDSGDKTAIVHNMIETLLHTTSKQKRDEVVSTLKADPSLRELFMKEKERMGQLKIPVCQNSNSLNESGISETNSFTSESQGIKVTGSSRSSVPSEAEIKSTRDLMQVFQSIMRSKAPEVSYDNIAFNIDHMHFIGSPESLEESNGAEKELITTDGAAVTCFPAVHSIEPRASDISETSNAFLHILSSDEADNKLAENFYSSNGAIFDNALHEHFQQLACDQYSVNNPFIMNNNIGVNEMQLQHHQGQKDAKRNGEN